VTAAPAHERLSCAHTHSGPWSALLPPSQRYATRVPGAWAGSEVATVRGGHDRARQGEHLHGHQVAPRAQHMRRLKLCGQAAVLAVAQQLPIRPDVRRAIDALKVQVQPAAAHHISQSGQRSTVCARPARRAGPGDRADARSPADSPTASGRFLTCTPLESLALANQRRSRVPMVSLVCDKRSWRPRHQNSRGCWRLWPTTARAAPHRMPSNACGTSNQRR